jgi:hypothetical protein
MPLEHQAHTLDGPDFLDAVADAEEVNGLLINAAEYRRRARQWREDRLALTNFLPADPVGAAH